MRWEKLGIVWRPNGERPWARTHASIPTPVRLRDGVMRIYVTCLDALGRGHPTYVDLSTEDPTRVLAVGPAALLQPGEPGAFDDNGLMVTSVLRLADGRIFMYYAGFELCTHIRYRIFTGLAISEDDGESFVRAARTPVLDRTDDELFFRCGSFVMLDEGVFRLWYVAGSAWTEVAGKAVPVYELRYQESFDGIRWAQQGTVSMSITDSDEHGFGRPWIVKRGPRDYQMFYSIRRRSVAAYRLGYAESTDGVSWTRRDKELGLDVSPGSFDSDAIMYSAVFSVQDQTYCLYNGNNFGEHGFAAARLVSR